MELQSVQLLLVHTRDAVRVNMCWSNCTTLDAYVQICADMCRT
jgi:hypothetical protein